VRALTVPADSDDRRRSLDPSSTGLSAFRSSARSFGPVSAVSPAMMEVFDLVSGLSHTTVTITLIGETGTGKDVLARAIHDESSRAAGPFVVFDCGAIAPNLAESELFGHERGAFTGALAKHPGVFERARGGTLFLDEIGELPLELQPKLLRLIDHRSVRSVGGKVDRRVDVRILAATNRDLAALVAAKQFRQDLYFRLAAAVVRLPALRERADDLPHLVRRLLEEMGHGHLRLAPETLQRLRAHHWPGNIRELKNTLAFAAAFAEGGTIEPRHLRFLPASDEDTLDRLPLGGFPLELIERTAIQQTLAKTRGNKAQAAELLGIAVSTLYQKLKKLSP
jgi:DNA-binding NtrC family response regulator